MLWVARRASHMSTTLMAGPKGQPYVYNTYGWPEGPAIISRDSSLGRRPSLLILTSVLLVICLNMVTVNNHMIVINMYIIFKYLYDSPVIVIFHYICNNASKYALFANFGSPNRTKS